MKYSNCFRDACTIDLNSPYYNLPEMITHVEIISVRPITTIYINKTRYPIGPMTKQTFNRINQALVEEYIDTSFIINSAVEVERLWSIAGNVLTSNRNKMLPTLMQVIIFLKVNRDMWDEDTVHQSIINSKNTERENRSRRTVALEERVDQEEAETVEL